MLKGGPNPLYRSAPDAIDMRNIATVDAAPNPSLGQERESGPGEVVAWVKTPAGGVALLILGTFLARLLFASALGLGVDESYMVAAGRKLQLS